MGKKDYYAILGVNPDATEEEVRTAYLKLALKWHPDKHANDDSAKDKFQQIGEAYHVLQDPLQRAEYVPCNLYSDRYPRKNEKAPPGLPRPCI